MKKPQKKSSVSSKASENYVHVKSTLENKRMPPYAEVRFVFDGETIVVKRTTWGASEFEGLEIRREANISLVMSPVTPRAIFVASPARSKSK